MQLRSAKNKNKLPALRILPSGCILKNNGSMDWKNVSSSVHSNVWIPWIVKRVCVCVCVCVWANLASLCGCSIPWHHQSALIRQVRFKIARLEGNHQRIQKEWWLQMGSPSRGPQRLVALENSIRPIRKIFAKNELEYPEGMNMSNRCQTYPHAYRIYFH